MNLKLAWILISIGIFGTNILKAESNTSDEQLRRCEEVLSACDDAFNQCVISEGVLEASLNSCEAVVHKQDELIEADKKRISDLAASSEHSHIPHVAATSGFWLILLLLL